MAKWTEAQVEKMGRLLARRVLGLKEDDKLPADLEQDIGLIVRLTMTDVLDDEEEEQIVTDPVRGAERVQ